MTTPRDHRLAAIPRAPRLDVDGRRIVEPERTAAVVDSSDGVTVVCEFSRAVHLDGDRFRRCSECRRPTIGERLFPPRVGGE